MTILSIKSAWKWEIDIIFQMLVGKSVPLFNEINKCSLTTWISSITRKISWIVGWPWSNHVCVSVRLCLSVIDSTNWYMGHKNKYWYFLSGNLYFGLEKSWKNHGTFFLRFLWEPWYVFEQTVEWLVKWDVWTLLLRHPDENSIPAQGKLIRL